MDPHDRAKPATEAERRAQKLAAALRANLRRRKGPPPPSPAPASEGEAD